MLSRCLATFVFCFLTWNFSRAQQRQIDSLIKVEAAYNKKDTVKADLLNRIAFLYQYTNPDRGLAYAQKAIILASKIKDRRSIAQANYIMGVNHAATNDIANTLGCYRKAATIFESVKRWNDVAKVYNAIGSIYLTLDGHYKDALLYFDKAINICEQQDNNQLMLFPMFNKAIVYKNIDSSALAFQHFKNALSLATQISPDKLNLLASIYSGLGSLYTEARSADLLRIGFNGSRYDTAIYYQQHALSLFNELEDESGKAVSYRRLADAYVAKRAYAQALQFAQKSKRIAHEGGFVGVESDANKLTATIYAALNSFDSAYFYQSAYSVLEDSILNDEKHKALIQQEMQYLFSRKEDSLNFQNALLYQNVALGKLRMRQQLVYSLGGLLLLLCVGGFLFYRNRNKEIKLKLALGKERAEQKQKEAEFERSMSDAALHSLRSQMNPHFIFNCLNSIKLYAMENKAEEASEHLGKFSSLMRLVLENSKTDSITLQKEIDTLRLYMDMEAMRFKEKLSYQIIVDEQVDPDYIEIPPMLIQPYVENAIWHGLMPRSEGGTVTLTFNYRIDNYLEVKIKDNGIGRAKAAQLKTNSLMTHKSFGMSITSQRIELINQMYQTNMSVSINDEHNETGEPTGTEITLLIPVG